MNLLEKGNGNEIRAELFLDGKNAADRFNVLEGQKEEIEAEMGETLVWYAPDHNRRRRIYIRKPVDNFDETAWANQHSWLKEKLEALHRVFRDRVAQLD